MMFPTKPPPIYRSGRHAKAPFDPEATYTAAKTIICHGKLFNVGDVFNKSLVNTRRLRQMYEQRMLHMVEEGLPVPEPARVQKPIKPDFENLSNDGLKLWLRNNSGYIPKPRTPRSKLLEMVEQKWQEYIDALDTGEGTR